LTPTWTAFAQGQFVVKVHDDAAALGLADPAPEVIEHQIGYHHCEQCQDGIFSGLMSSIVKSPQAR
jgi:hypothetical protein